MVSKDDVKKIAHCIGASESGWETDHHRLKVVQSEDKRSLVIEIYPETSLGKSKGTLVVVYTGGAHLQLHNCSGFVISEELGEVTFVTESQRRLSGLVVEKGASCSLYAGMNSTGISQILSPE